jgi:hypothetical protein
MDNEEILRRLELASPINPTRPCKVFVFNIGRFLAEKDNLYDATRRWWKITKKYRDVSEFKFAVGLVKGLSVSAYKLTKWTYCPHEGKEKYEFAGEPTTEFENFTWSKQIDVGFWNFGNHLVVEFDGKGKFQLIRPNKGQLINCV